MTFVYPTQAARDGKYDIVKVWLELYSKGSERNLKKKKLQNPVDEKDGDGLTALHYAARFNRLKILSQLLVEQPGLFIFICV